MRIGIDLDDVLVNFIKTYTQYAHEMFGTPADILPVDWEWSNYGLTKEQNSAIWERIKGTHDFWYDLSVADGVDAVLLLQLADKADLVFITARVPSAGNTVQFQSAAWLFDYLALEYPTVIVDSNKGPIAAALKLNYFIDDRPKNCLEIQDAVPGCTVYLKDSSHNLSYNSAYRPLSRVKDFNTFAKIVLEELK